MAPARDSDGSHNLRGDFLRKSLLGKTLFVVGGITLAAATIIILIDLPDFFGPLIPGKWLPVLWLKDTTS